MNWQTVLELKCEGGVCNQSGVVPEFTKNFTNITMESQLKCQAIMSLKF